MNEECQNQHDGGEVAKVLQNWAGDDATVQRQQGDGCEDMDGITWYDGSGSEEDLDLLFWDDVASTSLGSSAAAAPTAVSVTTINSANSNADTVAVPTNPCAAASNNARIVLPQHSIATNHDKNILAHYEKPVTSQVTEPIDSRLSSNRTLSFHPSVFGSWNGSNDGSLRSSSASLIQGMMMDSDGSDCGSRTVGGNVENVVNYENCHGVNDNNSKNSSSSNDIRNNNHSLKRWDSTMNEEGGTIQVKSEGWSSQCEGKLPQQHEQFYGMFPNTPQHLQQQQQQQQQQYPSSALQDQNMLHHKLQSYMNGNLQNFNHTSSNAAENDALNETDPNPSYARDLSIDATINYLPPSLKDNHGIFNGRVFGQNHVKETVQYADAFSIAEATSIAAHSTSPLRPSIRVAPNLPSAAHPFYTWMLQQQQLQLSQQQKSQAQAQQPHRQTELQDAFSQAADNNEVNNGLLNGGNGSSNSSDLSQNQLSALLQCQLMAATQSGQSAASQALMVASNFGSNFGATNNASGLNNLQQQMLWLQAFQRQQQAQPQAQSLPPVRQQSIETSVSDGSFQPQGRAQCQSLSCNAIAGQLTQPKLHSVQHQNAQWELSDPPYSTMVTTNLADKKRKNICKVRVSKAAAVKTSKSSASQKGKRTSPNKIRTNEQAVNMYQDASDMTIGTTMKSLNNTFKSINSLVSKQHTVDAVSDLQLKKNDLYDSQKNISYTIKSLNSTLASALRPENTMTNGRATQMRGLSASLPFQNWMKDKPTSSSLSSVNGEYIRKVRDEGDFAESTEGDNQIGLQLISACSKVETQQQNRIQQSMDKKQHLLSTSIIDHTPGNLSKVFCPIDDSKYKETCRPTSASIINSLANNAPTTNVCIVSSDTDADNLARVKHEKHNSKFKACSYDVATNDDMISFINQTNENKIKSNRERNREHAKNTRLRKKEYVERLKATVEELSRERESLIIERAAAANLLVENHSTRMDVLRSFFALRASYSSDQKRELWTKVLDENVTCRMPVTPYQSFPSSEVQLSNCQRTIAGVDAMIADAASNVVFIATLVDRHQYPKSKIKFQYTLSMEKSAVTGNQLMARWAMDTLNATECGARTELHQHGMLLCKFNSVHRIISLEIMFDVMAFMLQVKMSLGFENFNDIVVPNTVQTCQKQFDYPMVMTLAEHPYTIVQVNERWEKLTGYESAEVVGAYSCRILQGTETTRDELVELMRPVLFKRPSCGMLTNYTKHGKKHKAYITIYPLSTDSNISYYFGLTTFVQWIDPAEQK